MEKFIKRFIFLVIFSAFGFVCYKLIRVINAILELDKALPQYIENVYGEKPACSIQMTFKNITVKALFSAELIKKKEELETEITNYVQNHYPAICKKRLQVLVQEKTAEAEVEKENSEAKISDEGWSI